MFRENKAAYGTLGTNALILRNVLPGRRRFPCPAAKQRSRLFAGFLDLSDVGPELYRLP
jgi:hypothetical protein